MPKSSSLILEKFEIFNLGRISQFGPILNSKMHPEPPSYINSVHNLSVAISLNSFFQNMGRPTFSYFSHMAHVKKCVVTIFLIFTGVYTQYFQQLKSTHNVKKPSKILISSLILMIQQHRNLICSLNMPKSSPIILEKLENSILDEFYNFVLF